jgi:hypothetical protein
VNPKTKLLLDAIQVLRKNGWTRRRMKSHLTGGVCAVGAMTIAEGHNPTLGMGPLTVEIQNEVKKEAEDHAGIVYFNDEIAGSSKDVEAYLQTLAEKYSLEGA